MDSNVIVKVFRYEQERKGEENTMRKGIRGHDVSANGLEQIVSRCRELHFSELQLVLEKSIQDFEFGKFSEEYAQTLKKQLDGMHIAVLGSYINPSATNEAELMAGMDRFKEKIRYAQILKPDVVGTETGFYGDEMSLEANNSEEAYQHLLKNMKELVAYAEKCDVTVGIEGVHCLVINTPQRMNRIVRDLNSEHVKVIFDPVNYLNINNYIDQDKIINDMFELLSDKMVVVHAKDFVAEGGRLKQTRLGEGLLNYKLIFENMKKYNLDIPLISEEMPDEEAAAGFKNLENMKLAQAAARGGFCVGN